MSEPADGRRAYGHDQDSEPPRTAVETGPWKADLDPDDFDPDTMGGVAVNPATGVEYGEVDNAPRADRAGGQPGA